MEQKAVTYKTIKGMARDMAMSSGSNDFSYENYNIRITTRGKEDSLIVTNEKGTESNIIATRDVLKTVNNVFVGLQPDFYNNFKEIEYDDLDRFDYTEIYKYDSENYIQITIDEYISRSFRFDIDTNVNVGNFSVKKYKLYNYDEQTQTYTKTTDESYNSEHTYYLKNTYINNDVSPITLYRKNNVNDITTLSDTTDTIKFALNTEYPTDSDLCAKGIFKIKETPIVYNDETLYLLKNGEYVDDNILVTVPEEHNTFNYKKQIKEIVLGSTSDTGALPEGETIDEQIWNENYKELYKKITERNFEFSGFNARMNNIVYVSSENLNHIPVDVRSTGVTLPTGVFQPNDIYDGSNSELVNISDTVYKLNVEVSELGFMKKLIFSNKYPSNTQLIANQYAFSIYTPLFTKLGDGDTYVAGTYYELQNIEGSTGTKYVVGYTYPVAISSESEFNSKKSKLYKLNGYVRAEFNFDITKYFGNSKAFETTKVYSKIGSGSETSSGKATLNYGFYNRTSSCINIEFSNLSLADGNVIQQPKGPFYKENLTITPTFSGTVPPITISSAITFFGGVDTLNQIILTASSGYITSAGANLPSGYEFKTDGTTIDYSTIVHNSTEYNVSKYEILSSDVDNNYTGITNIETTYDSLTKNYYTQLTLSTNTILTYDKLNNTLDDGTYIYHIYKVTIDNSDIPYIIYTKNQLGENSTNEQVYTFSGTLFEEIQDVEEITEGYPMLPSDLTSSKVELNVGNGTISYTDGHYQFNSGSIIYIDKIDYLPVFETNSGNVTSIDSYAKTLYDNPTYNTVLSHFGFITNNFKSSVDVQSFRLKHSNNNWGDTFVYKFLNENAEFINYTKKFIPMSALDTYLLDLKYEKSEHGITFKINVTQPDNEYFGTTDYSHIRIIIGDRNDKFYEFNPNNTFLSNFIEGVEDTRFGNNAYVDSHSFYIKEIKQNDIPSDASETEEGIQFEDKYNGNYDVKLSILTSGETKYAKQVIDFGSYKTTSIIEFNFSDSNYKNKFYSVISDNLLIADFGKYHALTIPGRILGSCTIDDYVVLFFHYSSPALNFYWHDSTRDIYVLCPPNTIDPSIDKYKKLYTRNTNYGYDLAYDYNNGKLLKDDNNDYINGRNEDYIVKLKYIDARPDNKENEWTTICAEIANVSTQSGVTTAITEKHPYYSADILYHGNLGFNANNGIETIGYYESVDVIKVYFTDGKNQPRMIDIMTPLGQRNGLNRKWDSKSFDFIQEISGKEKYNITKQFGGGAFPAGSVQYYFTYTNLGGCETNPFVVSPIYYTSQSDTGNSPLKITDNIFNIKLTNLSNRFDYVNIYSVIRTSKDTQPLCKRVINVSLGGKTEIEFTDNNLLGEIVDSSYILMLQGTPISALTMAEKDNTLFLGNINKLQKNLSSEDKDRIKTFFDVNVAMREYQNYNPNEDNWYENKVKDKVRLDYYGNKVLDANNEEVIDSKISLEENSREIKTFMYNEYYRLGIQLQDKFGRWSDPIFIEDIKCENPVETELTEEYNADECTKEITNVISKIPYFYMTLKNECVNDFKTILNSYGYIRIRPVIVYPNISSRNVLCQGLINPTMFNYADRSTNAPFNFASYFFRPIPPAMSTLKDENGKSYHNPDIEKQKVCGYPIEYRHGYPITGYHEVIEEGLAKSKNPSGEDVRNLVSKYLENVDIKEVNITSNTPGWWYDSHRYVREGEIIIEAGSNGYPKVTYKAGCNIYKVYSGGKVDGKRYKVFKGDIYKDNTLSSDSVNNEYKPGAKRARYVDTGSVDSFNNFIGKFMDAAALNVVGTAFEKAYGFRSHFHYFRAAVSMVLNPASVLTAPNEIIKETGDTHCDIKPDCIIFNEGNVFYRAYYPITIKIIPNPYVKLKKHNAVKRKTYFVDLKISSNNIKVYSDTKTAEGYCDNPDGEFSINKSKAYFANNDGEIQCANGNKDYNLFSRIMDKVDETYDNSDYNVSARKQSLFYVDESVCTLNSPEIEYDPTIQKIDLSTYKLNIIGATNITGYANNISIDTETPPATAGTTVCEGFKFENTEVKNFNNEAYRYMLSGGYWYDNVFYEGDDEDANEGKYDNADLINDQFCWWVYPFNRQILNNSKEGANGKLRTKKWVNYHYSAFNDYFGKSSVNYDLLDAQQIYGDFQTSNIDTIWTNKKCLYFGTVDTAYTNPVPLVGVLGGSNDPDENNFEQSLAISPNTKFKTDGKDCYSATDYADIIPFSFRSSNHFILSLDRYEIGYNYNNILPEYYSNDIVFETDFSGEKMISTEKYYRITKYYDGESLVDIDNMYYVKDIQHDAKAKYIYKKDSNGFTRLSSSSLVMYEEESNSTRIKCVDLEIHDGSTNIGLNATAETWEEITTEKINFNQEDVVVNEKELSDNDYEEVLEGLMRVKSSDYVLPNSLLQDPKPNGCVKKYVKYANEKAGIYKYGHVYIAQLERGVTNADQVFSGTSESVLLQNTWIPAGEAVNIDEFVEDGIKWTEGDTFYQRYDCLKTFAYNDASVNQVVEFLSTMIQTRINLDGIYSLRGNVDNVGSNLTNTNLLNDAYSQSDNYFTYSITDPYIGSITEYSNMFTWTLTKQPMARNDNWLAVNLIAYYNATGSFGKITRIINYRNNLFCFQDNAISQIAYNERVALTPTDGVPIEIGNSGKVQGLNYISSNVGCQNRWSVMPSKGYLYWVDDRRAEIYRFGEGLEPFSTINGFSDWVKANTYGEDWKPIKSTNVPITTYYDNNNDDIYFVTEKDCLAYNEKLNAFESFFSYEDSFILNSAGNTIVIKEQDAFVRDLTEYDSEVYDEGDSSWWDNGIRGDGLSSIELMHEGEYNKFFGNYQPYYVRFKVYPTDLQRDKIYTNLEFNTDGFNEKDIYMPDDTFTRVRVWNEYQWGEMNFDNIYGTTSYKKRFRTWYLQLPRASYYPTGLYENYNYLYQRQLEWNYITSDVLADNTLAYYSYWNENSNCVNDRIRNPWVWLELYKNPKASLNFESYDFADAEVKNCTQAYYNEHKLDLFEIISGKFVRQDESSSYDENKKYYNCINDYLEKKNYLYYKVYVQVSSDDYDKYDILYNSTAEDAQPYTGDRTNPGLILYRLDYRNCANILTFDTEKVYYKLNISNNRMEIHDIILKYFEA